MEQIKFEHNTRDKIYASTERHKYSIVLGMSMKTNRMSGVFIVYNIDEPLNTVCICNGRIDPSLFIPTDEKAIKAIEDKVSEIIESYELALPEGG